MAIAPTDVDRVAAQLASSSLFAVLLPDELSTILEGMTIAEANPGDEVVREGAAGDEMFLVLEGEFEVLRSMAEGSRRLAMLGPGDVFGEMALVTGERRNASVVASSSARLGVITRAQFDRLVQLRPELDDELRRIVSTRLRESPAPSEGQLLAVLSGSGTLTMGSAAGVDVRVEASGVEAHHADLRREGFEWLVSPADGATVLVNREPISGAVPLADGDLVRLGNARIQYFGGVLRLTPEGHGVAVEADGLRVDVRERTLLEDITVRFAPGEMVAIVGPSGAGKSTLLNALVGFMPYAAGEVRVNGTPMRADLMRSLLGYVPQYDIVHHDLTVAESLAFTGRLRLPTDTEPAEMAERIQDLLRRLHLESQAGLLVGRLSGGQRKRACIAAELLTDPGVVFMDEPTSGLDPGLDAALMLQLRELADEGRTIVITTHATRNITLCDRVVVVNRGRIAFDGSPGEALEAYGVDDFALIYASFGGDPEEAVARYRESRAFLRHQSEPAVVPRETDDATAQTPGAISQLSSLLRRNVLLISRDRANLLLRLIGAPALAAMLIGSFTADVFEVERADGGNAQQAIILLYLACAITLFLGAFTSANVITSEAGVFRRERLVGLSPAAYVLAKMAVAIVFSLIQGFLFVIVLALKISFPGGFPTVVELGLLLSLVSFAGTMMAILISALSANPDRAAILVVLALIPQLIFAGATIPQSQMSPISGVVSRVTVTRWALELGGSITGLEERLAAQSVQMVRLEGDAEPQPVTIEYRPYEGTFDINEASRWAILAGFAIVFTLATWYVQATKHRIAGPRSRGGRAAAITRS